MLENTRKKVLVVDDESHILHILGLKLQSAGYQVVTAQNGREGFDLAQVERPDLVIADYQIPGLSGIELCQRLRQRIGIKDVPAILLTSPGMSPDPRTLSSAGVCYCFEKPFGPREVLRCVQELLEPVAV